MKKAIALLLVAVCLGFLGFFWGKRAGLSQVDLIDEKLALPVSEMKLERSFNFPLAGSDEEEEPGTFELFLAEAKKVRLIATQGEPVKAGPNQAFLILSLEIDNGLSFPFKIDNQNYFRLLGEGEKKYAPDFYNGPIQVAALSVKKDELAFAVPLGQKGFKLLVGPMDGQKEEVEISF